MPNDLKSLAVLLLLLCNTCSSLKAQSYSHPRDLYPDTWVGTDGLNRRLPSAKDVGPPKQNRTVGIFYFLTFERSHVGPYDNSKILAANPGATSNPNDRIWGPLYSPHYWAEPLFGYYLTDDDWVLRKHAQMLVEAGVDLVIFDNSNSVTYDRYRDELLKVWEQMRREGDPTPQIAFFCPFGNPDNLGTKTISSLYTSLYSRGLYSDLWFHWDGKPLIIADKSYADPVSVQALLQPTPGYIPAVLLLSHTLGQSVDAEHPFREIGGTFPTWNTSGAGLNLSLYRGGPNGKLVDEQEFPNVRDNSVELLKPTKTLPPGKYYLEASGTIGHVGWWGYETNDNAGAYFDRKPINGQRIVVISYESTKKPTLFDIPPHVATSHQTAELAQSMQGFFTFRTPIGPYNTRNPQPGQWAWLQIHPQAVQTDPNGKAEEITVGVAQNYNANVNSTAPMSFPGAFGRSYHDGREDIDTNATDWGYNFQEQWNRAIQASPPFVFVTGWNEWTASIFDKWAGFTAPPAIFVDEFDKEFSRDIEPMSGGFGDDYYYQLVNNIRRYKGVHQIDPVRSKHIDMQGSFSQWASVAPEFRDFVGDTIHRNSAGTGIAGPYINTTGRNDIVAAKVSYDTKNIYFYVRTSATLSPRTDHNWMILYLNTDSDSRTGWLGYDYAVDQSVRANTTSLDKNVGNGYRWSESHFVPYKVKGNELEICIPRADLGMTRHLSTIDFKWADNCYAKGDWTDFTLNGDAAPDGRFSYRAIFSH